MLSPEERHHLILQENFIGKIVNCWFFPSDIDEKSFQNHLEHVNVFQRCRFIGSKGLLRG